MIIRNRTILGRTAAYPYVEYNSKGYILYVASDSNHGFLRRVMHTVCPGYDDQGENFADVEELEEFFDYHEERLAYYPDISFLLISDDMHVISDCRNMRLDKNNAFDYLYVEHTDTEINVKLNPSHRVGRVREVIKHPSKDAEVRLSMSSLAGKNKGRIILQSWKRKTRLAHRKVPIIESHAPKRKASPKPSEVVPASAGYKDTLNDVFEFEMDGVSETVELNDVSETVDPVIPERRKKPLRHHSEFSRLRHLSKNSVPFANIRPIEHVPVTTDPAFDLFDKIPLVRVDKNDPSSNNVIPEEGSVKHFENNEIVFPIAVNLTSTLPESKSRSLSNQDAVIQPLLPSPQTSQSGSIPAVPFISVLSSMIFIVLLIILVIFRFKAKSLLPAAASVSRIRRN